MAQSLKRILALIMGVILPFSVFSKQPELIDKNVLQKSNEILNLHAHYKKLNPELMKRLLKNFLEEFDPTKTYFIESDIQAWMNPSPEFL